MKEYNLIIVGGGAAGILCAIEANKRAQEAQKTIPITANKKITTK